MSWPLASEFSAMLQKPQLAFRDPQLKACRIERDAMGQPRPWSGAFAVVYKAILPESDRPLAVRAFTSASPERHERYAHCCRYVAGRRVSCLVAFEYRDAAIRSAGDGKWYPLVLMEWVEGQTLFDWLREKSLAGNTVALSGIAQKWLGVVHELGEKRIAHGDLSHSNVLVTANGALKLVDYDGMCVPALVGRRNLEVGVKPYQHPQRDEQTVLSLSLDNYSALVIYVALRSLAAEPGLWAKHVEATRNDKLLFSPGDFLAPRESALFQDLLRSPDAKVRELTERLKDASAGRLDGVPPLLPLVMRPTRTRREGPQTVTASVTRQPRRWNRLLWALAAGALAAALLAAAYGLWATGRRGSGSPAADSLQALAQPANRDLRPTDPAKTTEPQAGNLSKAAPGPKEPEKKAEAAAEPVELMSKPREVPKAAKPPPASDRPPASNPPPPAVAPFPAEEARKHQARWASYLKAPAEIINAIGMKLVLIPPGEFTMGSPDSDPKAQAGEIPEHRVRITKPFYFGAYEVTVGQFTKFARETGYQTEQEKREKRGRNWRVAVPGQSDNHPVVVVTWNDAVAFSGWLSRREKSTYRLPTEAEWEYACRAGTTTRWSFGDDASQLGDYAWYDANTNWQRPHPVGEKKPNAWGLFDMHGNVEEWSADWDRLDYYASSPVDNPAGPDQGTRRIARGGSFYYGLVDTRSAWRDRTRPDNCGVMAGFRLARTNVP